MSQKRSRREFEIDSRREYAPYVLYGTPLPNFDENIRDDGSYVPIWKQEVRDEQGRKRLHGAFTGGFSAGYFNSVGSKEGWTPSTFVSSRSDHVEDAKKNTQQRVEDFMDDEDLRELEDSRQISTTAGFSGFGTQDDPNTQNVLEELFKPPGDTIGEQLLARMGWKKGQGIGPRVLKPIDPNDANSELREFPPEDSPIPELEMVSKNRGLGFGDQVALASGGMYQSADQSARLISGRNTKTSLNSKVSTTSAKTGRSTGIGVGSQNHTGSDDEDPYELGPKMSYNKILGKDKNSKKQHLSRMGITISSTKMKSAPTLKKLPSIASSLRKCHDGKLPLDGFVLASDIDAFQAMSLSDEEYQPPEVPDGWQPTKANPELPHDLTVNNASKPPFTSSSQTALSRANILGETPLKGKSVFDFISPTTRDKLVAVSGNDKLPPGLGEAPSINISELPLNESTAQLQIPYLDPTTATNALGRLRKDKNPPYSDDIPKQGRYKDFLRYSSMPNTDPRIPPLRAPHHAADEDHLAELHEFAATGALFKPAIGLLASRFMSASSTQDEPSRTGNITADNDISTDPSTTDLLTQHTRLKVTDPAEEAARMGMFGIATRSTISFTPTRLVCKRFGVELPLE